MEQLPPEILLYIVEYINSPSYLSNTMQTCSLLASVAKSCTLYKFMTSDHKVTRVAGSGEGYQDGDAITTARFDFIYALAFDNNGDLIISDSMNQVIRKLCMKTNIVSTFEGVQYKLRHPEGIAVDEWNTIFIVDGAYRIVYLDSQSGELKELVKYPGKWIRRIAIAHGYVLYTSRNSYYVESTKHPRMTQSISVNTLEFPRAKDYICCIAVDDNENIYFSCYKYIYRTDNNFETKIIYEMPAEASEFFSYAKGCLFFGSTANLYCLFVESKDLLKIKLDGVSHIDHVTYYGESLYFTHAGTRISKIDMNI